MSSWLKLSILSTVVFAFMAATAYAESSDVKYSESFSGNWKKVGTGESAEVQLFKSGRFTLQGTFKRGAEEEAFVVTSASVFSVSLYAYDVTEAAVYTFSAALNAFTSAFTEGNSEKSVDYTDAKRSAKAIKEVTNSKDKQVVVETVTFSHSKDKKIVTFTVAGSLVNVGTNTAPLYDGTMAAIDPDDEDDDGGAVNPGAWMGVTCGLDTGTAAKPLVSFGSSLPVDGTRAAKTSTIKTTYGDYTETMIYFNPSVNLKGAYKCSGDNH